MAGINKVILVGNLGTDPEVKTLESGTKVANISMATTESYRDKSGNWQDNTEWHYVVLWRYNAEKAEKFLKTGSQIYVEGKLRTRQWTDKDQNKRYTTEIVADKMLLLGSKDDNKSQGNYQDYNQQQAQAQNENQQTQNQQNQAANDVDLPSKDEAEDDLPF